MKTCPCLIARTCY